MKRKKPLLVSAIMAMGALALAACAPQSSGESGAKDGATLKVGFVTSETGSWGANGPMVKDGFKAGLDYLTNGTDTVKGIKINVTYNDDASDPDKGVSTVKTLVGGGATVIIGTGVSAVALPTAQLAAQNHFLYITGGASSDAITGINKYTFRAATSAGQIVNAMGAAAGDLRGKKVLAYSIDSAYGQSVVAGLTRYAKTQGATTESVLVPSTVTDYTPFSQQVLNSGADLVWVSWSGSTTGAMWQSLKQQGVLAKKTVASLLDASWSWDAIGPVASDIPLLISPYFDGANDSDLVKAVNKNIAKSGHKPDTYTADGYNAAAMLVHAIEKGGTDVDKMINALEGYSFEGMRGPVTIRATDHGLIEGMYQSKLVANGGSYKAELVKRLDGDQIAQPEVKPTPAASR
ncbi:ABC transporter substrate-binding protein [Planosporangium flavigriseum]|uniref:ABC transporter substrate-binding protein n=1 Tax=Planosporangium flavigriseum TaxID=373681 RepID=A0A8J3LPW4_9ACTN|nr:ABC transporter substrate-binding protein [Planosporangium flavigriseum]NJC66219.1 ABC transporter substrate-binding protein [Planosporangium flavigriseum]GIG74675.1 ABC transporter substrate-binding protein [Planosporangium flavigriseum]